ncbi:MAG: alpha/beta fold hydrolase [Solirubrobacteraceae bacterium]
MHYAHHGTVQIAYETFGGHDGSPLLLISGTAVQMLIWPDEFCQALADRGFHVARFDNRDTGLSTHLRDAPTPSWLKTMLRPSVAPYRLSHMGGDALAVMDALEWAAAHIVGASLGGMVAQTMAIEHPDRVRTLTSIMSTPSSRIATRPTIPTIRAMIRIAGQPGNSAEDAARNAIAFKHAIGGPSYPIDEQLVADIARRSHERSPDNESDDARQRAAMIASGDRRKQLANLDIPTLVIHGDHDPVIRLQGGHATAAAIPGAKLVTYPGMGHDLARPLWPAIIDEICQLVDQSPAPHNPAVAVARN